MRIRSARNQRAHPPARNPRPPQPARRRRNNNNDDDDDNIPLVDLAARQERQARVAILAGRAAARNNNGDASVDISDDEDGSFVPGPLPVFRLKKDKGDDDEAPLPPGLVGKRKKCADGDEKQKSRSHGDSDDDSSLDSTDDESVDIDLWLHKSSDFSNPTSELWGSYSKHSSDDGDGSDNDDDDAANKNIPISWLRSGFTLSKCGNGLAASPPSDDDWDQIYRPRRLHSSILRDVRGLFSNCKGVSTLLSIVTALIYSGASIRGGASVGCDVDRVPFDELTLEQRKREFDPRLVDALSSLIFVAVQAGSKKCEEKLAQYNKQWARRRKRDRSRNRHVSPEEEDEYTTKRLALQRRARVAHVCWWETDAANGNVTIFPEGKDPKDVKVKTSFTNTCDLRSYVKTHLRSFKEPGGCALLLETILHCHGPYMPSSPLLKCRCNESRKHLEKNSGKNHKYGGCGNVAMPEDHNCMTTELLSLLLTGTSHSTFENWSADQFGIGLLRKSKNNTAPRLLRPVKPIWICQGDLGYSTLFLDMKDFTGSINSLEAPGKVLPFSHWNC